MNDPGYGRGAIANPFRFLMVGCVLCASMTGSCASAIFIGQIDDFEDATTQHWTVGNPGGAFAPVNIADGGPGGIGDGFLQLSASGAPGPGGKIVSFNSSQWTGDYIAAGVTGMQASFSNLGEAPISMRLAFLTGSGATFSSSAAAVLAPGSGWTTVFFPLSDSSLVRLDGSEGYIQAFQDITEVRLLSAVNPAFSGDVIAATVGIDDVLAIPEPATISLILFAAIALFAWRTIGSPRGTSGNRSAVGR